ILNLNSYELRFFYDYFFINIIIKKVHLVLVNGVFMFSIKTCFILLYTQFTKTSLLILAILTFF
ncbi:hypothetical protein, partial [Polaribacter atrinae]|uniref:hypothetical protein n=1 Tax=Polaribacter atrinae TaxID=1333662 RepID=UPI001E4D8C16